MEQRKNSKGQIIIELLVAFGLAGILLPALLTGLVGARSGKVQQEQRIAATGYLKEAEEAVRDFRNSGWGNVASLDTTKTYHPVAGTTWTLAEGSDNPDSDGEFTRTITVADAIPVDPSLRIFTVEVAWTNFYSSSVSSTFYLTRWKNFAYSPLSASGTLTGQGYGDWCNPSEYLVGEPFSLGAIPIAISATTTSTQDFAYTSTGNNRSSGSPVFGLTVSHDNPPVVANPASSSDNAKAYGLYSDSSYVYFTEANPGPTVQIADAATLNDVGYFSGSQNGQGSVSVVGVAGTLGSIGYVVTGTNLYSFDLSTIKGSSSQTQLDSATISGNGQKLIVSGTSAYVVSDSTAAQLQVIPILAGGKFDIANAKSINLGNSQAGVDLALDPLGRYAYVITNYSSGENDFFIVDLSNDSIHGFSTHIDSGAGAGDMNPRGVAAVTSDKIVVVGCNADNGGDHCPVHSTGWIYQVFDIPTDWSSTTRCGGMTPISSGTQIPSINAVAGVSQDNGNSFAYLIDGVNSSSQFQIVAGGSGGGVGGNGGTFESGIFDCRNEIPACSAPVIFNSFRELTDPSVPIPSPSGVITSYRVAVSADPNCNDPSFAYNYTGSYGPSGGQIPLSVNPGYCFRYEVTFSGAAGAGNASTTVSVNYSP